MSLTFISVNGINNIENLGDFLRDCNFRDFEQLIPSVIDRITFRKKYNDYIRFIFIFFKFYDKFYSKIFIMYLYYYNISLLLYCFLESNMQ